MQINSVNAHLTNDASSRAQLWDAGSGPDLQLISAGTSLIVLARGPIAVEVFDRLHSLVQEKPPEPVATPPPPPQQKPVEVVTGLRSAT